MKSTVLSFKVESELKNALKLLAQRENRSLSNYVQTVLLRHIEEEGLDLAGLKAADKSK
jgi:predicted transcriptional regulator